MSHVNSRFLLPIPCNPDGKVFAFLVKNPGRELLIQCRVSSHEQKDNLPTQERGLCDAVTDLGGVPLLLPSREWSGRGEGWLMKLHTIGNDVRNRGFDELLWFSLDRLIRAEGYRSDDPIWCNAIAAQRELDAALEALGSGIQNMTYMPPNASPKEIRAKRTEWGHKYKGNKGEDH